MADDIPAETTPTTEVNIEGAAEKSDAGQTKVEGELVVVEEEQAVVEGEQVTIEGEQAAAEGEPAIVEKEQVPVEGEQAASEEEPAVVEGQQPPVEGEQKKVEGGKGIIGDGGEETGQVPSEPVEEEVMEGEHAKGEETQGDQTTTEGLSSVPDDVMVEEEQVPEEPPLDPSAPLDLSDSKEAMKLPFELSPEQLIVVESLWEQFQNHTPSYSEIDGYITSKELVYMLKSLFLMTHTPEQMVELVEFCVRPPHPEGHINWEQFLHIVTMRQRDFIIEEQIRKALENFDPQHTGIVDREIIRDIMLNLGYRMTQKMVDNFIKEVDISGDGELNIEDVIGTMCIDLNQEDLQMLRDAVNPPAKIPNIEEIETAIEKAEDVTRY